MGTGHEFPDLTKASHALYTLYQFYDRNMVPDLQHNQDDIGIP